MKYLLLLIILSISLPVLSKEDCKLKAIEIENDSTQAEKLFYTGTCHYRNKNYQQAAIRWKELTLLTVVDTNDKQLKVDVLNNLGFLMYFGYGIEKNQSEAIGYWKQAISLGHTEAEYHLCHAYAEIDELSYNIQNAKNHCSKALLIYKGMEEKDQEILRQLEKYNKQVNG